MKGPSLDPPSLPATHRRDQNDNLEGTIASDTVNTEVNTDSYRCLRLRIAG
jgi:hypothetical protein